MTNDELFSLKDQVALITGGSGDIGMAIAMAYARAGAHIALHGRRADKLQTRRSAFASLPVRVEVFPADISKVATIRQLAHDVVATFGKVDILVNCAGINRRKPILEFTEAEYEEIMAVHVRAAFFLSQAIAPFMIAQGGGKIIHVGSATIRTGLADVSVYGMAKASLDALTRSMAVEWAEHNIQVNCLAPGFLMTEMTREGLWGHERRSKWLLDRIPMRRPGLPEEIAAAALLLASRGSSYLTGQTIYVDGGFAAGSKW
ncbi:MAG: SDR family oxidoreductase [Thermoflexales bacterium]|nr:SDR family oxidoreductase [Thermoflexales bacterium]MDW8351323.1 SDR family oxidoreductase [Anaerolineae bacterium]